MLLITGGLGFIGSHFAADVCKNYPLVIVDNLSNSSKHVYHKLLKQTNKNHITFYNVNVLDHAKMQKIIQSHKINSVIHFAGLKSVGESAKYPAKYYYNNVIGSKILFDLIKSNNIQNLIFSSSATVYGTPMKLPLDEKHPIRSTNPYGQNKVDIENLLLNDSYFQNDCIVKILRYFNPIGAHPSGTIGESPKGIPNNLMPYILKVAKREYQKVRVFGNDYDTHDGTGVRDYIHIMDLVHGHVKALNYQKKGVSIFNLGTGQGYSVLDLIKTFGNVNNVSVPFEIVARRPGDVSAVYANPSKAESVLDFKAKRTLEDMCRDAWTFAKDNS
jgi:UDP-glucose 4-epimerase